MNDRRGIRGPAIDPDVLRLLRRRAKLTQMQLSERSGVSQGQIARLERGQRRHSAPGTRAALAAALEVPDSYLLADEAEPTAVPG